MNPRLQVRFGAILFTTASFAMTFATTFAMIGCSPSNQATIEQRDFAAAAASLEAKAAEEAEKKLAQAREQESLAKAGTKGDRKPASRGGVWVVQIGAFKQKENAEKLYGKLKASGHPVMLQTLQHSQNGELHLVRLEPVAEKTEAQSRLEKLMATESLQGQLLRVQ